MITVYTDGAFEQGLAAWGFVVYQDGVNICEAWGVCPERGLDATSNVAEYAGVIAALEYLRGAGLRGVVVVKSDSRLVVNQLSGYWHVNAEHLGRLVMQVRELERYFERVKYHWIPREQNSEADNLSKMAYRDDND